MTTPRASTGSVATVVTFCEAARETWQQGGRVLKLIGYDAGETRRATPKNGKASFDEPMVSLLEIEPITWEPQHCPLCEEGHELVHPGS